MEKSSIQGLVTLVILLSRLSSPLFWKVTNIHHANIFWLRKSLLSSPPPPLFKDRSLYTVLAILELTMIHLLSNSGIKVPGLPYFLSLTELETGLLGYAGLLATLPAFDASVLRYRHTLCSPVLRLCTHTAMPAFLHGCWRLKFRIRTLNS